MRLSDVIEICWLITASFFALHCWKVSEKHARGESDVSTWGLCLTYEIVFNPILLLPADDHQKVWNV